MTLTNPVFLWGLLALAVPIIVHLFAFRRTKKVFFSNISLINQVKDETKSRSRLQHLLIMACRLLFFLFLIMAFLQPSFNQGEELSRRSILYVDNSYSMSGEVGPGISGLDEALNLINAYVKRQPRDHEFVILTNDYASFASQFQSQDETLDYLTEISFSPRSRTFSSIISRITSYQQPDANIFLFSDFQQSTLGELTSNESPNGKIYATIIETGTSGNVYVDTTYLLNPFVNLGEKNEVLFEMRNTGQGTYDNLTLRLLNENKLVGSQTISIPPGGKSTANFELDQSALQSERLILTFEDFPVTFDNDFALTVPASPKVKVAVVTNNNQSYLSRVYGNSELFDLTIFSSDNIDFSQLSEIDLLVIEDMEEVPGWVLGQMGQVGQMVWIPSTNAEPSTFARALSTSVSLVNDSIPLASVLMNKRNPFYEGLIEQKASNIALPKVRRVMTHRPTVNSILGNEFGGPFISLFSQQSDIYLFTAPLDLQYTDLPEHAIFVPLMYRIAQLSAKGVGVLAHSFDESVVAIPRPLQAQGAVKVFGESSEFVPNYYFTGKSLTMEMPPDAFDNGFFEVVIETDTIATLAFNASKKESDLTPYTEADLATLPDQFPQFQWVDYEDATQLAGFFSGEEDREVLWKYALILALFFGLAEVILVRFAHQSRH